MATSARFGASFAGVDDALVAALTAFGEEVGVAFQISDDLLDIVSQGGASGKLPGTDLREGIATLPALFALAGDDPAEARLRELVAAPISDDADHAEALDLLRSSRSLARANEVLARVRRPRPGPAGRRAGRRRPRRAVGAVRLRGHPHQLKDPHAAHRSHARGGPLHGGRAAWSPLVRVVVLVRSAVVGGGARRRARRRSTSTVVADGLDHPWDVAQASDGTLLVDERPGGFTAVLPDGTVQEVAGRLRRPVRPRVRPGLMGSSSTRASTRNRRFYSCQGVTDGGGLDRRHRLDRLRTTGAAPPASPTR